MNTKRFPRTKVRNEGIYLDGTDTLELLPEEASNEDERVDDDEGDGYDGTGVDDAPVLRGARASHHVKAEESELQKKLTGNLKMELNEQP